MIEEEMQPMLPNRRQEMQRKKNTNNRKKQRRRAGGRRPQGRKGEPREGEGRRGAVAWQSAMVLTLLSEQDPPAAVTVVRTAVGKGADVTSAPAFPAVKSSYAVMLTDTPAVSSADEEVTVYTAVYLLHWSAPLLQELSCWILSVAGQVTPAVHLVNAAVAMLTDGMRISSDTSMLSVIMVFTLAHLG